MYIFIIQINLNKNQQLEQQEAIKKQQEATVRTGHETTDWFQTGKGVHQGCHPAYLTSKPEGNMGSRACLLFLIFSLLNTNLISLSAPYLAWKHYIRKF